MDIREDAHRLLDELHEDQFATAAELLRDSKNPAGGVLALLPPAWPALT